MDHYGISQKETKQSGREDEAEEQGDREWESNDSPEILDKGLVASLLGPKDYETKVQGQRT